MPLKDPGIYGTGADGMRIEDYCIHCYRDGGFTSDVTMEEMMRLCANYAESGVRAFYMADMRTLYPHLKRWAKREDTENEYYKSVNRVLEYVKANLHENTGLKTLAGIARVSPYHFHRIFKSVIGESLAGYVNRLRMEYVAEQLKISGLGLAELAERTGYSSQQALSRAFRKYFGIPPKTFKAMFFRETFRDKLVPRICRVASRDIVMLREQLPGGGGWRKLYAYAVFNRLLSENTESIEVVMDDVFRPALTVKGPAVSDAHAVYATLGEGLYAIFTHRGDTAGVPGLYPAIFNYWLPAGKYRLGEGTPYVVYLNNPAMAPAGELLAEIYIPLADRRDLVENIPGR